MIGLTGMSGWLLQPLLLEVADKMPTFSERLGASGWFVMLAFLLTTWRRPFGLLALAFAAMIFAEDVSFARSSLAEAVSRELGWVYLRWNAIEASLIVLATFAGWKIAGWRVSCARTGPARDAVSSSTC